MDKFFIIIHGPTGVGKTDFILSIGKEFPIEIINCDVGQMYEPVAIGTAKPDWRNEPIPHHLFDRITTPSHYSVVEYRQDVYTAIQDVAHRGKIPVLVGGSGFYGKSLFFPPETTAQAHQIAEGTWHDLYALDPQRASEVHENDIYRINRALSLIASTNSKASDKKPSYNPVGNNFLVIYLYRDREILYENINKRTHHMIENGWIEEVKRLQDTPWEDFLKEKKLIGYPEIFAYLQGEVDKDTLIATIQKKTRNYAKRQETFWRMFKKMLIDHNALKSLQECNLSNQDDIQKLYSVLKERVEKSRMY